METIKNIQTDHLPSDGSNKTAVIVVLSILFIMIAAIVYAFMII